MTKTNDATMSPREAAKYAGVSHQTVYEWLKAGLPVVWVGLKRRVRPVEVDRWLAAQRKARVS